MLGETLNQPMIFLNLLIFGFLSGMVFDALNFFWLLCGKNKVVKHFLDALGTMVVGTVFFLVVYMTNYGEIRLFEIVVFALMFFLERKTLSKLFDKVIGSCYNLFIKLTKRKKDDKISS